MLELEQHNLWVADAFKRGNVVCIGAGTTLHRLVEPHEELVIFVRDCGMTDNSRTCSRGECRDWCDGMGFPIVIHPTYPKSFYVAPQDENQAFTLAMRWR